VQFVGRQAAGWSLLVGDLRPGSGRSHVVAGSAVRFATSSVRYVINASAAFRAESFNGSHLGFDVEHRVDEPAAALPGLGGTPTSDEMTRRRQLSRELLHVVEASPPPVVHELGAERAHPVLGARRPVEVSAHDTSERRSRMRGWIEEDHHPQRRHVVAMFSSTVPRRAVE